MLESVRPKSVAEWLAEIDCTTCMENRDHSRFAFDTDRMEFETL